MLITNSPEEAAPQHRSSCTKRCQIACGDLLPLHCLTALHQLPLEADSLALYPSTTMAGLHCTQHSCCLLQGTLHESLCFLALKFVCLSMSHADCIKWQVCSLFPHCTYCLLIMHCSAGIIPELMPVTQETSNHRSSGYTKGQLSSVNTYTSLLQQV